MRKAFILIALTTVLTALACSAPAQPAAKEASVEQGKPVQGGTLRLRQPADPWEWDFSYGGLSNPNQYGVILMTDGLLAFKTAAGLDYAEAVLAPALSERWETSQDVRSFTFHLRKGARFANGREVTAADVKWSYEYLSRTGTIKEKKLPQSTVDWVFTGMEAIETPDPSTVVVKFQEPFVAFLGAAAADNYTGILPREVFDADGHFKDRLPGPGPFQLDLNATQKGTRWVFKKNPDYYQAGLPRVDEVHWLILPDDGTSYTAFRARQLDAIGMRITLDAAQNIRQGTPDATMHRFVEPTPLQVFFQVQKAPFDDARVRKAVALSINRDEFVKAQGGQGAWAISGGIAGLFTQEQVRQISRYDVDEAKRLLREAGYPEGLSLDFYYPPANGDEYVSFVQLFQAQLRRSGINLNLKTMDKAEDSRRKRSGDFQLYLQTSARFVGDVSDWVYSLYLPGTLQNFGRVDDPRLTAMVKATQTEPDPEKRKERVREAARHVYENAWGLAVHHGVDHIFAQPYVKGVYPNFWAKGVPVPEVWLEK